MTIKELIRNKFLKIFGDIKIYKYPLFVLYDPNSYKVSGDEVRHIINTIQPGDILIRGYKNYLDGYFIPGFFSHAGVYLGATPAQDDWPEVALKSYKQGEQITIHSMAEGVFMEDILNFCKCDYLLILRRNTTTEPNYNPNTDFSPIFNKAIKSVGKPYDFTFDFSRYHTMSCTEFVYSAFEDIMPTYSVKIKKRRALITKREMIIPDDFVTDKFEIAFQSKSIEQAEIDKIIAKNNLD